MKLRNALMLVVVAGCGGSSDSPATMPDGSNVDAPVTPPRKPATKFADTAESRSVPSSGLSDGFCSPSAASGTRHWATIDVDGGLSF